MKLQTPPAKKLASMVLAALAFSAGVVCAQTSIYYTSGSGATASSGATFGGTLASIGFDMYQSEIPIDTGVVSTANNGFGGLIFTNFGPLGLASTLDDGSTLTSVTFNIFVDNLTHPPGATTWNIFSGLNGTGSDAGSFTASYPANDKSFISFTVNALDVAGGFSLAALTDNQLLNLTTESNLVTANTPLIVANYAIPEPSTALLGAIGAMVLLRRRRA